MRDQPALPSHCATFNRINECQSVKIATIGGGNNASFGDPRIIWAHQRGEDTSPAAGDFGRTIGTAARIVAVQTDLSGDSATAIRVHTK